jgi:hypothetical protein
MDEEIVEYGIVRLAKAMDKVFSFPVAEALIPMNSFKLPAYIAGSFLYYQYY